MKIALSSGRHRYIKRAGSFLVMVALIAGMAGCVERPSKDLEIRDWYDMDAVRYNLRGHHRLMNDLNATTAGYEELAGPTANDGKGWQPIGPGVIQSVGRFDFSGGFDGQGHEIRDLFINRPDENQVGLFGSVLAGRIENVGLLNASVTGNRRVGGLVGDYLKGTVSQCRFSGNVTGEGIVGGLVGSHHYASIRDCHSAGSMTAREVVGGLVGENEGIVENCYSTAVVTGDRHAGGLIGMGEHPVSNSFWDVEASGTEESDGGTGKTTAEMMDIATFMDTATEGLNDPWDMVAVAPGDIDASYTWNIVDGETYPFLSWESVHNGLIMLAEPDVIGCTSTPR